jgi:hypothetical protein
MDEWIPYRITGEALHALASSPRTPARPSLDAG